MESGDAQCSAGSHRPIRSFPIGQGKGRGTLPKWRKSMTMLHKYFARFAAVSAMGLLWACTPDRPTMTEPVARLNVRKASAASCDWNVGGGTSPMATIQAGIDAAAAGNTICVYPGIYNEFAPGSTSPALGAVYQFGLFFPPAKPGMKLIGVDGAGVAITDPTATQATINTNATNNFGASGIFVDAANTTIQGVKIGPNASGDNKTIEVIADNFTLQYATTAIPDGGGSIYINDWSTAGDVVKSYHVLDNLFPDGTSVDPSSGAGKTGPVSGREILRNTFDLGDNGYIYAFTNVRRIGGTIQGEIDNSAAGGIVRVRAGTYNEDVVVNKANLQLLGAGADLSVIVGQKDGAPTTLEIPASSPSVLVDGFTITRTGNVAADWTNGLNSQGVAIYGAGSTLRKSKITGNRNGVFLYGGVHNVRIENNIINNNRTGLHLVNDVTGLVVQNNFITNNWTMGILFRDESSPNTTGAVTIVDNDISGNWYSQVEGRSEFSAPALDVTRNWLGTTVPNVFVGASGEPGYDVQVPMQYGGTATPPFLPVGRTIAYNGLNTTNPINYIAFRCSGTDASADFGFQPSGALSTLGGQCLPPAPAVTTAAADASVNEGTTLTASGSFSGTGLTLTANNAVGTFTPNNAAGTWTWSYPTTDDVALATITVTATDGFAQTASDMFTFTAANVAPSAVLNAPATVAEGSSFSIALGSPTDPSSADVAAGFTYAFSCGGAYGSFSSATSFTCTTAVAGSLTVGGKIKDKNGAVSTYTKSVTVQSSKQVKSGVRTTLAALLPTTSGSTSERLRSAIAHLDKSLSSNLWTADGSHLTSKGEDVFEEEKSAVEELRKIKTGAVSATVAQAVLALVNVDKQLAQTAINEAPAGRNKTKALASMAKAAHELADGHPEEAIDLYKEAWKQVTHNDDD
ncbi:MAG: right-handed parallel beta-helix repeat-containing protein [Gemmatimonadetes bacterium]|nr:right-handed parallel beta-helix repeat-containing protein [Gemmatimonadota bacterium]